MKKFKNFSVSEFCNNFLTKYGKRCLNILMVVTILAWLILVGLKIYDISSKRNYDNYKDYPARVMQNESALSYYQYKGELVKEVKAYIDSVAPTSALNGYAIVDNAEKYDLDIKFVLAQGQIESHFGTTGMAAKTNSVFNVGAFDNMACEEINGRYKYKHPDHSIEPYMRLLYNDYIGGKKTELDLMAKYVNKNGQRYSSNMNYENEMLRLYTYIDKTTRISELQGEMKKYKIISGV